MSSNVKLGGNLEQYRGGEVNQITFVLTEECNLRCHYCYMVHKNSYHVMSRKVAFKAIDFFLSRPDPKAGVVWEFIGGEPTLEIELIEDIIKYFYQKIEPIKDHPWKTAHMFMIGTNGTTYHQKNLQRLIWENYGHVQCAITIDGTKKKHDMHRVFKDGRGSYDIVAENVKLWLRQNPYAITKVTFSSDDLSYLCESVLHIWELGVKEVAANVVFENAWKPGDSAIFENQLRRLADIAIEKSLWKTHNTTLFWFPFKIKEENSTKEDDKNWCGTGKMVSVDDKGNLYPCVRFQSFSLSNPKRAGRSVGNIYNGFDQDKLRAFHCLRKSLQSPQKCLECDIQEMCAWCSAFNYDSADTDTIFQRMTFICEMHKARWRANQYYWKQLEEKCGINLKEIEMDPYCTSCAL